MPFLTDPDDNSGAARSAQTSPADDVPFESSLDELAGLVSRLESGTLGLTESIEAYERGVALLRRLHELLAAAEERVRILVRIDDQGRPLLAPTGSVDVTAGAAPPVDAAGSRTGKTAARTGRGRRLPGMDDTAADG